MPSLLPLLHTIPLSAWRPFLAAHAPATKRPKSLSDVARTLQDAPPSLGAAIRAVFAVASDDSRAAMLEGGRVLRIDTREWPQNVGPAELGAFIVTHATKDEALRTLLESVRHRLCRRAPIAPVRRYIGRTKQKASTSAASLARFGKLVAQANLARGAVGEVEARVVEATDARIVLDVVCPEPLACGLVRGEGGALTSMQWTPVRIDHVVLERSEGDEAALWITTGASELLAAYRQAVGEALLGDAAVFARSRPISLRMIQRRGRAALDVKKMGIVRLLGARIVAALWDPGREETFRADGRDVLAAMDREELPLDGLLIALKIRLDLARGEFVDLTLRLPNVVHWEPSPHDDVVRQFVARLGLDEETKEDYLALAPYDRPELRWREVVGDAVFDGLLAGKYFTPSTTRALAHPLLPSAGRVSLAFPLGEGRFYVSPEEGLDVEAWVATEADLVTYQLDVLKLARTIARELGLSGDEPAWLERGSLVDLGERAIGAGTRVRVFLVTGVRTLAKLRERLVRIANGAHPVLLVPEGYRVAADIAQVEIGSLLGPFEAIPSAMAKVLRVEEMIEPRAKAPEGTRLVVDRSSGRVWLDGTELVKLAEAARKLVRILIEAGGGPLLAKECDRRLSSARTADGAAKQAKKRFVEGAKASYAMLGKTAPADLAEIIEGTGVGYRLTVAAWIG